jgi:hypothetical protein
MRAITLLLVGLATITLNLCAFAQDIDKSVIVVPGGAKSRWQLKVSERKYLPLKTFQMPLSLPANTQKSTSITWPTDSLPNIEAPQAQDMRSRDTAKVAFGEKYNNVFQVGAGNYGHTILNFNASYTPKENKFIGVYLNHDANAQGPVQSTFSSRSENQARLVSRYLGAVNSWEGSVAASQQINHLYGMTEIPSYVKAADIRVNYSYFNVLGKILSARKNARSDYKLTLDAGLLQNPNGLSERIAKSHLYYSKDLTEKVKMRLDADYIHGEYVSALGNDPLLRSFYRINPSFAYASSRIRVNAGILVATEQEGENAIAKTSIFPQFEMDFGASDFIHLFGGIGGDVQFNSLKQFLVENPWMAVPTRFKNTNQVGNLYGGIKGVGNKYVDFEIKYNYAEYADLPLYVNSPTDMSKFDMLYIGGIQKIQVTNLVGQVNVHVSNAFTSSLKVDQVTYSLLNTVFKASHKPGLTVSWTNTWKLSNKLFISPDVYYLKDLYALNPAQNQLIQLEDIVDLNVKINYFVKRNVNLGLSGNNLVGKTYQRFNQYKNQGRQVNLTLAYSF